VPDHDGGCREHRLVVVHGGCYVECHFGQYSGPLRARPSSVE
jgi:hypothetical protein